MEVKSANVALQLNRAASGIDHANGDSNNKGAMTKGSAVQKTGDVQPEEESVKIYISAAGMRISKTMEQMTAKEADIVTETEVEDMRKMMEGLSSQVINGHFSMTDRLQFKNEIKRLTNELDRLNGDGISFSKADNIQLSRQIQDLTRSINKAAVYHNSAKAFFVVNNQQTTGNNKAVLDIAL